MENQTNSPTRRSLTPGQRTALDVAITVGLVMLGAFIGSSFGRSRGYREGLRDGTTPLDKARLDAAREDGYDKGWWDGMMADDNEAYNRGMARGIDASMQIYNAGLGSSPLKRETERQLQPA